MSYRTKILQQYIDKNKPDLRSFKILKVEQLLSYCTLN